MFTSTKMVFLRSNKSYLAILLLMWSICARAILLYPRQMTTGAKSNMPSKWKISQLGLLRRVLLLILGICSLGMSNCIQQTGMTPHTSDENGCAKGTGMDGLVIQGHGNRKLRARNIQDWFLVSKQINDESSVKTRVPAVGHNKDVFAIHNPSDEENDLHTVPHVAQDSGKEYHRHTTGNNDDFIHQVFNVDYTPPRVNEPIVENLPTVYIRGKGLKFSELDYEDPGVHPPDNSEP